MMTSCVLYVLYDSTCFSWQLVRLTPLNLMLESQLWIGRFVVFFLVHFLFHLFLFIYFWREGRIMFMTPFVCVFLLVCLFCVCMYVCFCFFCFFFALFVCSFLLLLNHWNELQPNVLSSNVDGEMLAGCNSIDITGGNQIVMWS